MFVVDKKEVENKEVPGIPQQGHFQAQIREVYIEFEQVQTADSEDAGDSERKAGA